MTSGVGETASRGRGGAGGKRTDRGIESVAGTDTENRMRLRPKRRSDSSTMNAAGRTASAAKRARNRSLEAQTNPLFQRSNPTLNCRGRSRKTQTHSEGWSSSTTSRPKLVFPSAGGDCTHLRMTSPCQSCTSTDRVPTCWGDREESLISPLITHRAPSNTQYSSTGKNNYLLKICFLHHIRPNIRDVTVLSISQYYNDKSVYVSCGHVTISNHLGAKCAGFFKPQ